MAQAAQLPIISHYTAYKPRPFTREERDKVTILYGGLTWKHERLMQGALHNHKVQRRTAAQYCARRPRCRQGVDRCGRVLSHHLHYRKPGQLPEEGSEGARQGRSQSQVSST